MAREEQKEMSAIWRGNEGERFTSALQVELPVNAKGLKSMLTSPQSVKMCLGGHMFIDRLSPGSSFLTVLTWKMVFLVPFSQIVMYWYGATHRIGFLNVISFINNKYTPSLFSVYTLRLSHANMLLKDNFSGIILFNQDETNTV